MNRQKSKNKWNDHYSQKAKKENYPARSVFKLQEIQKKFRLMKKGDRILDLGCSPGSWLLYAAEITGKSGEVVGIDIKDVSINVPGNVRIHKEDIFSDDDEFSLSIGAGYNVILSDMAPDTTGNKFVDTARSYALCEQALEYSKERLAPGGSFVCKIFQGEDFKAFSESVRSSFKKHKIYKPQSSRKASKEIFIIGIGKK